MQSGPISKTDPNLSDINADAVITDASPVGSSDVTAPLKNVMETFPARLLLACVFFGPFWVLLLVVVANRVLPAPDAAAFKNLLAGCLTSLVVSGGGGAVAGSLFRTWGKINSQLKI